MRGVGTRKPKVCVVCSLVYTPSGGKQKACPDCSVVYWRSKHAEQAKARQRQRKLMAIEYLGGKCSKCFNEYHPSIYEFHHRNPKEKESDPAQASQLTWEKFKLELDKCDLLCANCHRLTHHNWASGV